MDKLNQIYHYIFSSYKRLSAVLIISGLLLMIPLSMSFFQNQQDIRQRASEIASTACSADADCQQGFKCKVVGATDSVPGTDIKQCVMVDTCDTDDDCPVNFSCMGSAGDDINQKNTCQPSDENPTPTCTPRPACLEPGANPVCAVAEPPGGFCNSFPHTLDIGATYYLTGVCTSVCTGEYRHTFVISDGQAGKDYWTFSGTGNYIDDPKITWDIAGTISPTGEMKYKITYTGYGAPYSADGIGKFDTTNGTWTGTNSSSYNQTANWTISKALQSTISSPGTLSISFKILGITPNRDLIHPIRYVDVDFYNAAGTLVYNLGMPATYASNSAFFNGSLSTASISAGTYLIKVKTGGTLWKQVPGIVTINGTNSPQTSNLQLINGDVNGDNVINIADYNLLLSKIKSQ